MLTSHLLHPDLLRVLAASGHGSQVLIADGNYPAATAAHPDAERIYLNVSPGVIDAPTALSAIVSAIVVESVTVMATAPPHPAEPPIWPEFREVLRRAGQPSELDQLERHAFYQAARCADVSAVVATAETAVYANVLLTIGVRPPKA